MLGLEEKNQTFRSWNLYRYKKYWIYHISNIDKSKILTVDQQNISNMAISQSQFRYDRFNFNIISDTLKFDMTFTIHIDINQYLKP